MQKTKVSPAELQQAKALLLRQIPLRQSSEDAVANGIVARARIGLPLDEPFTSGQRYFTMNAAEVKAAFAKWIHPSNFVQVVRGPARKCDSEPGRRRRRDQSRSASLRGPAAICAEYRLTPEMEPAHVYDPATADLGDTVKDG